MIEGLKQKLLTQMIEDPVSGCWLWTGATSQGYGQLTWNTRGYRVHRASWLVHNGPIPEGLCVLHKCDRRRCFNPEHLFLGTHQDNMDDKIAKGRFRGSIGQRWSMITPELEARMAMLRKQGLSYERIGIQLMLSYSTVRDYLNKQVPG